MILEQCKGVHCVDLGESFQTHIYLQNFVSIQPRTSPVKFARSSGAGPNRACVDAEHGPSEQAGLAVNDRAVLPEREEQEHVQALQVSMHLVAVQHD